MVQKIERVINDEIDLKSIRSLLGNLYNRNIDEAGEDSDQENNIFNVNRHQLQRHATETGLIVVHLIIVTRKFEMHPLQIAKTWLSQTKLLFFNPSRSDNEMVWNAQIRMWIQTELQSAGRIDCSQYLHTV